MKKLLAAAFTALALLTSCSLDTDYVYVGAQYLIAKEEGGSFEAPLYASGIWSASISATEGFDISISPASGTGDTTITITIGPMNTDLEEGEQPNDYEMAYIVFTCGDCKTSFPVYQMTDEYFQKVQEGSESVQ